MVRRNKEEPYFYEYVLIDNIVDVEINSMDLLDIEEWISTYTYKRINDNPRRLFDSKKTN